MSNPLIEVQKHGQSLWYDYISRDLLLSGELRRLVEEDGVLGVTSNPAIFEKAIAGSSDYDPAIQALVAQAHGDDKGIYEALAIQDIQLGCDVLRGVFDRSERRDGYVSLEVAPDLAYQTEATIEEARRLWNAVGRPNLMIKVPATREGLPAIEELIAEGINVNATLLFALDFYEGVHEAYQRGIERRIESGGDAADVASVASFFISRIDAFVDGLIDERLPETGSAERRVALRSLKGRVAIANAKLAYASYKSLIADERWQQLAANGARPQRLLWASTSVKNPSYRDVLYVEELIGPDTVNTMPDATYEAFRDHGIPRPALEEDLDEAADVMETLGAAGISIAEVTDKLQADAVRLFVEPFDKLLATIEDQCSAVARRA